MQVLTLLSKIVECSPHFDIQQNDDNVVYACYFDSFVADEIDSIADVGERGDYSVVFRANSDCNFEIVAIGYDDDDGSEVVCDVGERIRNEMKSRGLLEVYYTLCELAVNQV